MKKLLLTLIAVLTLTGLVAQPRGNRHNNHGSVPPPPPATPSIIVESQHGETFQVYINGDLVNTVSQNQVVIDKLGNQIQDVIVVLTHPARKAGVIQAYATMEGTHVIVNYDMRSRQLFLYEERQGGGQHSHGNHAMPPVRTTPPTTPPTPATPPTPPTPPAPPTVQTPPVATDAWVNEMVALIGRQNFDSEKLTTAKGLLAGEALFTSDQITRIARTFDFNSAKVDFLKSAYLRCVDPENYERALTVLDFMNDRQAVRAYINSLR